MLKRKLKIVEWVRTFLVSPLLMCPSECVVLRRWSTIFHDNCVRLLLNCFHSTKEALLVNRLALLLTLLQYCVVYLKYSMKRGLTIDCQYEALFQCHFFTCFYFTCRTLQIVASISRHNLTWWSCSLFYS